MDNNWVISSDKLTKTYIFSSFLSAIQWMNEASIMIDQLNHHPEWTNIYNKVHVEICTHDKGNIITEKDRDLAARLDLIFTNQDA